MLQYRNGLIGKHFKTLIQTTSFHIHDIVSSDQFTLARTLGELAAVLWIPSIPNLSEYLVCPQHYHIHICIYLHCSILKDDLEILIGNVLDAFANIEPSKILIKIKLHVLVHLPKHIRRRGPAVRFSTEVYECFNAVFRMCSVLSNHQAPSRDIAYKFVDLDRVKHIMSGGYWLHDSQWVTAGCDVRNLLFENPVLQRHLGWVSQSKAVPGLIKGPPHKKRMPLTAGRTLLPQCENPMCLAWSGTEEWFEGVAVTSLAEDVCKVGSWGVFRVECSSNVSAFLLVNMGLTFTVRVPKLSAKLVESSRFYCHRTILVRVKGM